MEKHPDNLATALDAYEKGIACIPVIAGTKVPAVPWKRWQGELPPVEFLKKWFETRCNIALICTGMALFDCETAEVADLVLEHCGATPHMIRSPRGGVHLGYRRRKGVALANRVKIKGLDIDLRTDGGLELIPPSSVDGLPYEWLGAGLNRIADLPVARVRWTRERARRQTRAIVIDDADAAVRRARAYLACIEGAVAGQRGHDRTMRVAGVLVQKFGLDVGQSLPLFLEWNARCEPPWTERDLLHKLESARKNLGTNVSLLPPEGGP